LLDSIDHIIIAVEDLSSSIQDYTKILGFPPAWQGFHPTQGTENAIFPLENLYVELLASNSEGPGSDMVNSFIELNGEGLCGISLSTPDIEAARQKLLLEGIEVGNVVNGEGKDKNSGEIRKWKNLFLPSSSTRGLFAFLIQHSDGSLPPKKKDYKSAIDRLDHIVINTNDPEGVIKLYRDVFDIRLALDQTVEKWGGRMLFFRLNHTTIEVIARDNEEELKDTLWGLAWVVKDLEATYSRLISEGLEVTEIKEGRKPKTKVATVKSNTRNIPTLLIQHL
tara:strand:+ start:2093 stop:2932 length:840 start_codon:yes stop_codon:yes gene_type:complete